MPNYIISQSPGRVVLRNFEGVITTYTEPMDYNNKCTCDGCSEIQSSGVASLLQGKQLSLEPENLDRKKRNH